MFFRALLAQRPVGGRRYRKPIPPAPRDGVRPCLQPGPAPPQPEGATGGMAARYRVREGKSEEWSLPERVDLAAAFGVQP